MAQREIHDGKYLAAGGPTIHYRIAGAADRPPILLLHGWPQDGQMWLPTIERIADRGLVITPDLRGFGRSETTRSLTAEDFVNDQLRLLDHLGVDRVHLVGHDWGGWTGFLIALRAPDRVVDLTVVNAPHPWPRLGRAGLSQLPRSWYAAAIATPGLGPALLRHTNMVSEILLRGSAGAISTDQAERLREHFAQPHRASAISSLYRYYWRAFGDAARGVWSDQTLIPPTLLLFGRRDRMISAETVREGLGRHAPLGSVEFVDDAGHFLCDQRPDLVAERIRARVQPSS